MKITLIAYFTILSVLPTLAQDSDIWTAFWDEETELMGFKNTKGQTEIEPKFMGFTMARRFEYIMAAMEDNEGQYEAYYLTKSGKKVGYDSLYIAGNAADCENEGFIRFSNNKTDKVGMLDKHGNVTIPAIYDALSSVNNGMVWALTGAKKQYWDNHRESGCNHYSWKGGQEMLLNTANQTIIENFDYEGTLDLFSIKMHNQPSTDSTRQSFKGANGRYYIFTDIEKNFNTWFKNLLKNLTPSQLETHTFDSVTYWKEPEGWITSAKSDFLAKNFELIKERLLLTEAENADFFISIDALNPFMYEGEIYSQYFNNCGEGRKAQYPVLGVIINHKTDTDLAQDHFSFLKTTAGYQLIEITIRNGEIK